MTSSRENLGLLLGFIGVVLFGGTLPATRLAVTTLDPWFVTAARATLPGFAAVILLVVLRRPWPREHRRDIALVAFFLVLGFPALSALAMVTVPAAHGGVVLGILPLATAAAATLVAGERPSARFWLVGIAGATLVVAYALRHGGSGPLATGDLLLLASIVTAAAGYAISGRLTLVMPGWEVITWACALSLPPALIATVALWPADAAAIPAASWLGLGYVAMISQFLAFFAWNAGLALGGIARVAQVQLLQTFVTVALAGFINGEAIDTETIVFAVAVVATVMLGRRVPVRR